MDDPVWWRSMLGSHYLALVWLPIRFFEGASWLASGEGKLRNPAWMDGGTAVKGFWSSAVAMPTNGAGTPKITFGWYRDFLTFMLNHGWYTWFAKVIAVGEFMVGVGLIAGAFVGPAALGGALLNWNFMLAGSASSNPVLFLAAILMVFGWKVAGWFGLDRLLLPALGTPWQPRAKPTAPPQRVSHPAAQA